MDAFAALADPTRRQILELLARDGPISATEIVGHFHISPPAISQHLKVLREAHLVHMDKRAQQRIYRINPDALLELERWATRLAQLWNQRFDAFEKVLQAEKQRLEQQVKEENDGPADLHDRS
ncbi:MAG TPA: metalloregulator ArsR/SmtB family transcription factor [Roseiflexaceae bacterium]|nr:metalloregulator ArsR/SmtB family transcription factor [Roseiflexaceae bacterium]